MWLVCGDTMLGGVASDALDEVSWKNFMPSIECRMLAGRLPMALTSEPEEAPLSAADAMVDMLCWERCLLIVFQPLVGVVSAVED